MIILGIDPGLTRAGYGLIKKEGSHLSLISCGLLQTSSLNHFDRLLELNAHLKDIISQNSPVALGLEKLYFSKNKKTGLAVAESRGAIILTAKNAGLPIFEFDPTQIKSSITGFGQASKKDIKKYVELILKEPINKVDDALDALAIAILTASCLKLPI